MPDVHSTALVHPGARLADDAVIGPYAVIGEHVVVGARTRIDGHAMVEGRTTIGDDCHIFPFCSIGQPPQDLKYAGEPTRLVIGNHNVCREYVTLNLGTGPGGGVTTIGDHNFFMAYVHVAHDCHIGHHAVLANAATLAGHVTVGDWSTVGGLVAVHQFVRIGAHAMIGGSSGLGQDVPPYLIAAGRPATLFGLNAIGLKRRGFSDEQIQALKQAYQMLFRSKLKRKEAIKEATAKWGDNPVVMAMLQFIEQSERGICSPNRKESSPA
ncbi:MAG: acyl-ACP--UDP-N-acetylglucosamine O-acyltransferase [Nitrospirae bacterium]|nr:acyl-ACP--UDP-N-acetylglucosamine O-acyltransferase [Nitrospirota bacterium]